MADEENKVFHVDFAKHHWQRKFDAAKSGLAFETDSRLAQEFPDLPAALRGKLRDQILSIVEDDEEGISQELAILSVIFIKCVSGGEVMKNSEKEAMGKRFFSVARELVDGCRKKVKLS